jgi:dihydrolipoamide dehydrogenase
MAVGSSNDFDLVVLGAGTGGYTAAFRAAQLGLKVALVDQAKIGGHLPPHRLHPDQGAARIGRLRREDPAREGLRHRCRRPGPRLRRMAERRDQVVKRLWTGLKSLIDKNKVTWIQGTGVPRRPDHGEGQDGRRR